MRDLTAMGVVCILFPGVLAGFSVPVGSDDLRSPQKCRALSPQVVAVMPAQPSPPSPIGKGPTDFDLNVGRAIDTLRHDYPRFFIDEPDLSIFTESVELHDPSGKRLRGLQQYDRVFQMLRFLRRTTMQDAQVTYRVAKSGPFEISVRWSAKLWMRDPALGLTTFGLGEAALVHLDGVSRYSLDDAGMIRMHRLENIIFSGGQQQDQTALQFAWPRAGVAVPDAAMPFFRMLGDSASAYQTQHAQQSSPATNSINRARRAPEPRAAAVGTKETPMERAARERAEDEDRRQKLIDRNERRAKLGQRKNLGPLGFDAPQQCETSYDCDPPQVCCDLLFAQVCCSAGLMIPKRNPVPQRQAIPIPVEAEAPYPDGSPGGGAAPPRYPGVGY